MLEAFGDIMQENIEHINNDSTPLPINLPFIRALMVATFMPIFVLEKKKTSMNLRGGVDEPTTIVGLLGDGVATQRFFFQISKVGGLEIFQKKT